MTLFKHLFSIALLGILMVPASAGVVTRYHNFAQVADGGDFQTTFLLFNPDVSEANATLQFRLDNGTPWKVLINGEESNIFNWTIPGNGMISVSTSRVSTQVTTGWAELTADAEVGAQAFFESFSGDQLISQAAVESTGPVRNVNLFVKEDQDSHTGIALTSLSRAGRIRLEFTLTDEQGQFVASGDLSLGSRHHVAKFLSELLPTVNEMTGILNIRGSGPFEVITLQLTGSVLGTLPAIKTPY